MLDFHPLAEAFPRMTGEAWILFKHSIKESGGNEEPVLYRLVGGTRQGLDGRNRFQACTELHLTCKMKEVQVSDDEVEDWILRRNFYRRQMTPDERAAVVGKLHKDGRSYKAIAHVLGISLATAKRDGQRTAAHCEPPLVYCRPCRVSTPREDCPDCKRLREEQSNRMPHVPNLLGANGKPFHKEVPPPLDGDRDPGDDSETVEGEEKEAKIKLWKRFTNWCNWLHHLKHAPEAFSAAFPAAIPPIEALAFQRRIDEELAVLKRWKKNMEKRSRTHAS